ncbi:MAG: sugar-binding protein [Kiritimatiellia bacterium]|jgi:hypothetical protein
MKTRNSLKRSGLVRWLVASLLLIGTIGAPSDASARVLDYGWCTVTEPEEFTPGEPLEVSVTIKPDFKMKGEQLSCHLHWAKKEGYGGFLSWHPPRNVKPGETCTFKFTPNLDLGKMTGVMPIVFLAPNGAFEKSVKSQNLPVISIKATPEVLAKLEEERKKAEARAAAIARPATATLKRSRLRVVPERTTITQGDSFTVAVEYELDPSDNWADGTHIELIPLGPWVDNPDGKYTTSRTHHGYPGLGAQRRKAEPGKGTQEFKFTLGGTFRYNELQWLAQFIGGDGKAWPWSVRGGGPAIARHIDGFDFEVPSEGGLFTYDETPRVDLVWGDSLKPGEAVEASFKIVNADGETVNTFKQTFTVGAKGTKTPVKLPAIEARGTLLLLGAIGDATRDAFFARIPDVLAVEKAASASTGKPRRTPFGVTNVGDPALSRVARKLGATYCRHFIGWAGLEPIEGQYRFEGLDKTVDANRDAGIWPWICIVGPPSWAMADQHYSAGYEPFTFKADAWRNFVRTAATRYQGRIWGFEWLNEIVPGNKTREPVAEYLDFCRIGTEAVRQVDPTMKTQLAGGLWPRNFRNDLLNVGVGDWIDVLPIHYGGETSIRDARQDVAAVGKADAVAIWDNETARGLSVWKMPPEEALTKSVVQSKWMMRQWPAELTAGAEGIIYFGGHTASAGNWTYLLDASTPRPAAATYAVLSSAIGHATPVASTCIGDDALLHIFRKHDGTGVVVACTVSDADDATATLTLPTGAKSIACIDHQGNSRRVETRGGVLTQPLGAMPVILDGFDFPTLAIHAGLQIGSASTAPMPVITSVSGSDAAALEMRAVNPLDVPVKGRVRVKLASGATFPEQTVALAPGAVSLIRIPLTSGTGGAIDGEGAAELQWTTPVAASCRKAFKLVVLDPKSIGNLLKNGDFEAVSNGKAANWHGEAASLDLSTLGDGPGFEGHAVVFSGSTSANYQHVSQGIDLPAPGRQYLYSAWVWNQDMQAGSNLSIDQKTFFIPDVFDAGNTTPFWRLMTHVRGTPDTARKMGVTPVVRGKGWARYDNVRVTLYDGSLFAAEARRAQRPVVVDGNLDDWDFADPIPLLCDNQLHAPDGYRWTPANVSGVARFSWDREALYFAAKVRDDRHVANTTGERTNEGDSLLIALHPGNRVPGTDAQAFAWLVGAGAPGGGSGRHTLYRPPARSGGLSSGQLAKDSSIYDIAIVRKGDITAYELRIPWPETGGLAPAVGVKAGLSIQLFDADGGGEPAVMTWGGGLRPAWRPSGFGVLTLVE